MSDNTEDDSWLKTFHKDDIHCPICGYVFTDSWEVHESGVINCDRCGKEFYVEVNHEVYYSTTIKEAK